MSVADELIELSKDWRCTGAEAKSFRKLAEFMRENESLRADLAAARKWAKAWKKKARFERWDKMHATEAYGIAKGELDRLNAGCFGCVNDDGEVEGCENCKRWGSHNPDLYETKEDEVERRR